MNDEVRIRGLRLRCKIGVPEEERADFQELKLNLTMTPRGGVPEGEDLAGTVDYAEVVARLETLAAENEFVLVETMARRVAELVLADFAVEKVRVVLKKFILPQTKWVGVALERSRG